MKIKQASPSTSLSDPSRLRRTRAAAVKEATMPAKAQPLAYAEDQHAESTLLSLSTPPLSPEWGFVVQFRIREGQPATYFAGRVEHLTSGRAQRFNDQAELLAFLTEILAQSEASTTTRYVD